MYSTFSPESIQLTKYLFFTGKGGVGKTSTACALAVALADKGKRILLISTDPASNLQDVFGRELDGKGVDIPEVPGLVVANLNPEHAAAEYRESVVGPYRGKLPESVITNMEEQLSGSCTVEIAAFDQFSSFITDPESAKRYDHILFDTAPTGHTLRMLQLPSAWSDFISESTHGASCLGQLAGLDAKKSIYKDAVANLADAGKTTVVLVSRPESSPLEEADRSSRELGNLGIRNQAVIINGLLAKPTDTVAQQLFEKQQAALEAIPAGLKEFPTYAIPLRSYNVLGIDKLRTFFTSDALGDAQKSAGVLHAHNLNALIDDLYSSGKKVVFTMGKGGVGKTSVAASIALGLARKGVSVHLTSTDPANHLGHVTQGADNVRVSHIDEQLELKRYQDEVLARARETMGEDDLAYVEEDLRSPCTQEIAVFRAFAEIVDGVKDGGVVVIDTAPTGHTLLLLDATQSYHREIERSKGETPESVQRLLPRLRDENQTEIVIVTLPEATPVFEAMRLREDLLRAGTHNKWWVINQSFMQANTSDPLLSARAQTESTWIEKVSAICGDSLVVLPWLENSSVENFLETTEGDSHE